LRYWLGCTVCALALTTPAHADSTKSLRKTAAGVEVRTETALLTVEPWSDSIVHVRFGTTGFTGNYNPAVIAAPQRVSFTVRETPEAYILSTTMLIATIAKKTAELSFANAAGATLLEDADRDIGSGTRQAFKTRAAIYGLGQHANGLLDYSGSTVHLQQKNGDVAVPMMLSPSGFGILWNNASVMDVDVAKAGEKFPLVIRNEAGPGIDYHFILGPEPDQVIAGYRWLTGDAPMMPRWSWGFWQSKERYQTQEELVSVGEHFRSMNVPIDAVVLDWQHWKPGDWGAHRFDPERFPDPAAMVRTMRGMNVRVPISVWPRFDLGTANHDELQKVGGLFADTFTNVYPAGEGRWYDPWNPAARQIYWNQIKRSYGALGFDTWWLDASEGELGGQWGEMREQATAAGPGIAVYNSYPLLHTTAVHDGMRRDMPDKRVMILTRSAFAGQQRNGALTWSGDTHGTWDSLKVHVAAALNFSMSGIPYWSADIGGFFGGEPKDPAYAELFARWHQFAIFNPQFRVHGTGAGKEIWNFAPEVQPILIDDVKLRYRLLPYIYSLSWDVTKNRGTMMRALVYDFRDDAEALKPADEYMFGKAFLVAPVVEKGATKRGVYLPRATWYDFFTGRRFAGGQTIEADAPIAHIPVFVRAGSIVPLGPVKPYADAPSAEPIELRVYPGANGSFALYDDAGDGFGYEKGEYSLVKLSWDDRRRMLTLAAREGSYPGANAFKLVCASAPAITKAVSYTGRVTRVALASCR
jgi:alpha-D-xyloside xylohydrolase